MHVEAHVEATLAMVSSAFLDYMLASYQIFYHLLETPPLSYLLEAFGSPFSYIIASIVSHVKLVLQRCWKSLPYNSIVSCRINEHVQCLYVYYTFPSKHQTSPPKHPLPFPIPFITQVLDVSRNHGDFGQTVGEGKVNERRRAFNVRFRCALFHQ